MHNNDNNTFNQQNSGYQPSSVPVPTEHSIEVDYKADIQQPTSCWPCRSSGAGAGAEEEAQLIEQAHLGDFKAVELLYTRYSRQAFGLALRMLHNQEAAQDAVQEAFLRFWKKPTNYNSPAAGGAGGGNGGGRFINWLLTVVRNICLDYLRKPSYQRTVSLDHAWGAGYGGGGGEHQSMVASSSASDQHSTTAAQPLKETLIDRNTRSVEDEVWLTLQREIIKRALETLPPKQRLLVETAYFTGLTYQQIADQNQMPLGTVKSTIRRGLLNLRTTSDIDSLKL